MVSKSFHNKAARRVLTALIILYHCVTYVANLTGSLKGKETLCVCVKVSGRCADMRTF